jgi:hypothetical protein
MRKIILLSISLLVIALSNAQSVSINTDGSVADTSAILDAKSTAKGVLVPRMTKTQRSSIYQPANGLLVYQSGPDSIGFYYFQNEWKWLADAKKADSSYWSLNANTGIVSPPVTFLYHPASETGNLLGTRDVKDLVFITNSWERLRLKGNNSYIGLSCSDPQYAIDATMNYDAVVNCVRNGIRLKLPLSGYNAGCDVGYFMGFPNALSGDPNQNDVIFWNFDKNLGTSNVDWRWGFGADTASGLQMKLEKFRLGIATNYPLYALDMKMNPDVFAPCGLNGIRMRLPTSPNDCNTGFFMGYPHPVSGVPFSNDIMFWNFDGSTANSNNYFRWGFGTDTAFGLGMKLEGYRLGIAKNSPLYALDIRTNPDGVIPCNFNGIRIIDPQLPNECYKGMVIGVNPLGVPGEDGLIWNYGNGTSAFLRFGLKNLSGEVMRIVPNRVGINITNPEATLHIQDADATRNGLLVSSPTSTTDGKYFFGGKPSAPYEMEIVTDYNDPIRFYPNRNGYGQPALSMHTNSKVMVGPNTSTPHSTLEVDGTIALEVSSSIAGGADLTNMKSVVTLSPVTGNDNYTLPNPVSYPGRIYYLRNIGTVGANLTGGIFCPASSITCSITYVMPAGGDGKTIMLLSDGISWVVTIMK